MLTLDSSIEDGQVSTSVGYDSVTQTTTLTIPPITTDKINFWNVNVTAGVSSSVIYVTSSILPPPFTITDDRNPKSQSGVTHPPVTRTIFPPPFPYTTVRPTDYPSLTHITGLIRNPCRSGCGLKCRGLFCNLPCLLNCIPRPPGFHDPIDPNPGGYPDPNPTNTEPTETSCTEASVVTDYWVSCSTIGSGSDSSSCTTTSSSLVTGCDVTATDITTEAGSCPSTNAEDDQGEDGSRPAIPSNTPSMTAGPTATSGARPSCSYRAPDPGANIPLGYCVCDGSITVSKLSDPSTCQYTSLPSQTINPQVGSLTVVTDNCQVCTRVNENNNVCTTVPNCTPTATSTPRPTTRLYVGYPDPCTCPGLFCDDAECLWKIYAGSYDPCADDPVIQGASYPNETPQYPFTLGSFDVDGLRGCTYTKPSASEPGSLDCNGIKGVCSNTGPKATECWWDYIWQEQVSCTF